MNYFNLALRVLLGLLFIVSAILKLFPIEAFDAKILELFPFFGWTFSMILARVIIGFELALGILIAAGCLTKKIIYPATLAMLTLFTLVVIYSLIRFGNQPNCGCFGELLPFSNVASLAKNLALIALTFYLYKKSSHKSFHFWWIPLIILAISILTVFLMHKIPVYGKEFKFKQEVKAAYLHRTFPDNSESLNKKHLMIFLSPNCSGCQKMAQKLQTIHRVYKFRDAYIFIRDEEKKDIEHLFKNGIPPLPSQPLEPDTFDTYMIAPFLPLVALVDEHGIYKNLWTSYNFNLNEVIPLLQQEGILEK